MSASMGNTSENITLGGSAFRYGSNLKTTIATIGMIACHSNSPSAGTPSQFERGFGGSFSDTSSHPNSLSFKPKQPVKRHSVLDISTRDRGSMFKPLGVGAVTLDQVHLDPEIIDLAISRHEKLEIISNGVVKGVFTPTERTPQPTGYEGHKRLTSTELGEIATQLASASDDSAAVLTEKLLQGFYGETRA